MSAAVKIRRGYRPGARLFDRVDPWDVFNHSPGLRAQREAWHALGGPGSPGAWLLTEPSHQAKASKASRPEYILHLAPERVAGRGTVCPWSTPGCRAACLNTSGHGSRPTVQAGRIARTMFAVEFPTMFLQLLVANLEMVARRHALEVQPFVRLNGTSDIAWERSEAGAAVLGHFRGRILFGDYTKATPDQRPDPSGDLSHYRLARSVWTDRHTVTDVAAMVRDGHRVSALVDSLEPLRGLATVADATATDEWLLASGGILGALAPLGRAKASDAFSGEDLARELIR